MNAQRLPLLYVTVAVDKDSGAVTEREIVSHVPTAGDFTRAVLGPFPADADIWPLYEAEARRIGMPESEIAFARDNWFASSNISAKDKA